MKAKVIIENGQTTIVLLAENEFEKDVIEKVKSDKTKYELDTMFKTDYSYSYHSNHNIEIKIKKVN